ncbi:RNA-binding protein YlmH, contains S4-like domain [Oscillibacter sp. PC13]|uniref:YlmH family RNA-binding protein n=1 Tax=Oscillibacter sp. PC13 TaxID=1855299 RepID=UPI0008EAB0C5|nr:YlmH/Sll1252 family protein [Oscillibacter sp. PC13]SFP01283.1 RNA-binding protein YlmH, contains S4-like domain [Oscillibacter sp. PC13]
MDKSKLLDRVSGDREDRLLLAKVLDRAEQTRNRSIPTYTDFLSPQQQMLAVDLLRLAGIGETSYTVLGGYGGAERNILLFLPEWMEAADAQTQSPIRLLRASFRPEFHLTHRDFLGSLMGMGIVREKVGDILVGKEHCDLAVLDTVAEFLLQNWDSAGRAKLQVAAIEPVELQVPEAACEMIRDTVSSLRLDAVVSTGFKMARGKAVALIESGKVQVNWRECTKPDKLVEAETVVSARGLGKFELTEVGGVTRKGRISIVVKRYI